MYASCADRANRAESPWSSTQYQISSSGEVASCHDFCLPEGPHRAYAGVYVQSAAVQFHGTTLTLTALSTVDCSIFYRVLLVQEESIAVLSYGILRQHHSKSEEAWNAAATGLRENTVASPVVSVAPAMEGGQPARYLPEYRCEGTSLDCRGRFRPQMYAYRNSDDASRSMLSLCNSLYPMSLYPDNIPGIRIPMTMSL